MSAGAPDRAQQLAQAWLLQPFPETLRGVLVAYAASRVRAYQKSKSKRRKKNA